MQYIFFVSTFSQWKGKIEERRGRKLGELKRENIPLLVAGTETTTFFPSSERVEGSIILFNNWIILSVDNERPG